jgi:fermentation-respiration switch protein FrsA (DUF1100 family)
MEPVRRAVGGTAGVRPHGLDSLRARDRSSTAAFRQGRASSCTARPAPFLVVIGDKVGAFGAYRDGTEIYGRAPSKHKELFVAEDWSHYDLYDKLEPVRLVLARAAPFFKKHPANAQATAAPKSVAAE